MSRSSRSPGPLHPGPDAPAETLARTRLSDGEQRALYDSLRDLADAGGPPAGAATAAALGLLRGPEELLAPPPGEPGFGGQRAAAEPGADPLAAGFYTALPAREAMPVLAGLALAAGRGGRFASVVACLGSGPAEGEWTGAVHEGLAFAARRTLPLVVVAGRGAAARARGTGVPAEVADGSDPLDVYGALERALTRARRGGGATVVEVRPVEGGAERHPARRLARHLLARGLATAGELGLAEGEP